MAIQNPDCATGLQAAPSPTTPYDEMLTLAGGVRDHYAGLHQRIATLAPAEMAEPRAGVWGEPATSMGWPITSA